MPSELGCLCERLGNSAHMLTLPLSEEAPPQGMRLMRTEVENHAGGRPPGLTLTESGVLSLPPCCVRPARDWAFLALLGGRR